MRLTKGTAVECLKDFARRVFPPKGAKGAARVKIPLAEFVGVEAYAVTRWLNEVSVPVGAQAIRLAFFLHKAGYEVEEIEHIKNKPPSHQLAEMLGYGVLAVEDAAKELGFSEPSEMFRLARGGSTSETRKDAIARLYELHRSSLQEKKLVLKSYLDTIGATRAEQRTAPQVREEGKASAAEVAALASAMLAILPFMRRMVAATSRLQREELRTAVGAQNIFDFSNAAAALCSEKAREVSGDS